LGVKAFQVGRKKFKPMKEAGKKAKRKSKRKEPNQGELNMQPETVEEKPTTEPAPVPAPTTPVPAPAPEPDTEKESGA
jgi:hypothetical protein